MRISHARKTNVKCARKGLSPGLCEKCRPIGLTFLDDSIDADRRLGLLAELLLRISQEQELSGELASELGSTLNEYLEKKRVRERALNKIAGKY